MEGFANKIDNQNDLAWQIIAKQRHLIQPCITILPELCFHQKHIPMSIVHLDQEKVMSPSIRDESLSSHNEHGHPGSLQ